MTAPYPAAVPSMCAIALLPVEGAFGNLTTGMRGDYEKVSPAYLQTYLDEYAWRHNAQRTCARQGPLFEELLARGQIATLRQD